MSIQRKQDDIETYYYHLGLDFIAKVSLEQPMAVERISERFKREAAKCGNDEDSAALRGLSNVCQVFLNDL